jgi:hypothetical protein
VNNGAETGARFKRASANKVRIRRFGVVKNATLDYYFAKVWFWPQMKSERWNQEVIAMPNLCLWFLVPALLSIPVTRLVFSPLTDRVTQDNFRKISSTKTLAEVEAVLGPGMTATQLSAFCRPSPERLFGHEPDLEEDLKYWIHGYGKTIADLLLSDRFLPKENNRYWISQRTGILVHCDANDRVSGLGFVSRGYGD